MFGALPVALTASRLPEAILLTPLVTSLTFATSWLVATHLNLALHLGGLFVLVAVNLLVLVLPTSRGALLDNLKARTLPHEWGVLMLTVTVFGLLSIRTAPPTAWDARYIWLARGQWYLNDAERVVELLSTDRVWAHPGYPPLVPATLSTLWRLLPNADPTLGITAITLLSVSTLGLAALLLARLVNAHQNSGRALLPSATVLVVGSLGADGLINDGYVDALLAGVLLAAVIMLVGPSQRNMPSLLTLLACAALLKQEGLILGGIIVALALPIAPRRGVVSAAATLIAASMAWQVSLQRWDIPSTSDAAGVTSRITELVNPGSRAWSVVRELLSPAYRSDVLGLLVLGVASIVLAHLSSDRVARTATYIGISGLLSSMTILGGYVLGDSRDDLSWWFPASFSRISAFPVLAASASLALIGVGFLNERATGTHPEGSEE
jgi:hypothetical protein